MERLGYHLFLVIFLGHLYVVSFWRVPVYIAFDSRYCPSICISEFELICDATYYCHVKSIHLGLVKFVVKMAGMLADRDLMVKTLLDAAGGMPLAVRVTMS